MSLYRNIITHRKKALVDRFKHDIKYHYGFDTKEEKTEAEIFALEKDRQIRRKYIIRK